MQGADDLTFALVESCIAPTAAEVGLNGFAVGLTTFLDVEEVADECLGILPLASALDSEP
jgi:hypothetical protein